MWCSFPEQDTKIRRYSHIKWSSQDISCRMSSIQLQTTTDTECSYSNYSIYCFYSHVNKKILYVNNFFKIFLMQLTFLLYWYSCKYWSTSYLPHAQQYYSRIFESTFNDISWLKHSSSLVIINNQTWKNVILLSYCDKK